MTTLDDLAKNKFGIEGETLLEILKNSHGAEGYLFGAIGEQLFKRYAEAKGYEVLRIKEKPDGGYDAKSEDARGDFYIRKKGNKKDEWFVVECKSVKSNAEKRANLLKPKSCLTMLEKHSIKRESQINSIYKNGANAYNKAKETWLAENPGSVFPEFRWSKGNPGALAFQICRVYGNRRKKSRNGLTLFRKTTFRKMPIGT